MRNKFVTKHLVSFCTTLILLSVFLISQTVLVNAEDKVDYTNAPYAGVYQVMSDKAVTLTNETGHTVTLTEGEIGYFYLIKGSNKLTMSDSSAVLTFSTLEENGLDYIDEVEISYIAYSKAHTSVSITNTNIISSEGTYETGVNVYGAYLNLYPGAKVTLMASVPVKGAGIVYPYLNVRDKNVNNFKISSDTGFYARILKDKTAWQTTAWADGDAQQDMEFLYVREGTNYITLENTGSSVATIGNLRLSMTYGNDGISDHAVWGTQIRMENLRVDVEILTATGVNTVADELAFYGKVTADYRYLDYGVKVEETKFYGAKDGDTVSDGADGTTTFIFGDWDGTFEIILTNITEKGSTGEKVYQFFVGDYYTEKSMVTIE